MPVQENISISEQRVVVVTFRLGNQTYALPISRVQQIIEMVAITPLPQVNPIILGVINFHGELVPVINMRHLLGLEEIPLHLHTPIILMKISKRLVGLIVDNVLDVLERPFDQVVDPNKILLEEMGETPLLQGLIQAQGRSILVLNPDHLFKPIQVRALSEAIDTLTESVEVEITEGTESSQDPETSTEAEVTDQEVQKEPEVKPSNPPKKRSRKKTTPTAKSTKKASA
jgi:purine-binding chemotaxis protein CheW